ncbi:uncharacterized protein LOC112568553 [Pomacea canaliculata]|uniref:uncharacterized protein LOC112568553 n=1 Tax=Pomacea canaliculata TaxID=400727 RepID=UPI000D725B91|nr:uncharacterized protein LOC112568553 [Pomacea canaliculata]
MSYAPSYSSYYQISMPRALWPLKKLDQMKRHITVLSLLAFVFVSSVQGKESRCDVFPFPTDHCAQNITITIDKRHVEMRKSLTLHLETPGMKEPVVMLNYVGDYTCETSKGYLCSKVTKSIFSIIAPCVASGSFRLSVDGEQDISCLPSQQNTQPFEVDQGWRSSEDSKFQKDGIQASKQSEDMTGVIVGVTIGMSILLIGLISALTFFLIKRRRRSIRERNHPADVEDPFIDGKSTGMVNFHENSKDSLSSSSDGRNSDG